MTLSILFCFGFVLFLLIKVVLFSASFWILLFYLLLGLTTFLAFQKDKLAAIKDSQRIPEKTLFILAFAGGWPGAFIAQQSLRHKSKKVSFRVLLWLSAISHLAFADLLFWPFFF